MKFKKGIGPVVATALLLVVAVVSVVGFSSWMNTHSSSTFVDVETKSISQAISIESVSGNYLYVKNSNLNNETIDSINVGGVDCSISQNISYGVTKIDIGKCFDETNSIGEQEIYLVSDSGVVEKNIFFKPFDYGTCVDITNGLVGLWDLDSSVNDSSPNSNIGSLYGDTRLLMNFNDGSANDLTDYNNDGTMNGNTNCGASGNSGFGCSFDGVDDGINIANQYFNNYDNFTYSLWVKADNVGDNLQIIVAHSMGVPDDNFCYGIRYDRATYGLTLYSNNPVPAPSLGNYNLENWTHLALSHNVAQDFSKLYINGVLFHQNISSYCAQSMVSQFKVGKSPYSGHNFDFDGSIDELAIYSRDLSDSEILDLYNSQSVKFVEYKNSNLGKSLEFDGVDDYVDLGNSIKPSFPFSVSLWFNLPDVYATNYLFFNDYVSGNTNYYGVYLAVYDGKVNTRIGDGGLPGPASRVSFDSSNVVFQNNTNHHYLVVFENISSQKIYVDGVEIPLIKSGTGSGLVYSGNDGYLGATPDSIFKTKGSIDDIAIYDRVLNFDEIKKIYNRGLVGKPICEQ